MVPFLFIPLTEVQNPKSHLYYGSLKFPFTPLGKQAV